MNAVDQYLDSFSEEVKEKTATLRSLIKTLVPDAEEVISYGIPTFKLKGKNLIHFAGYKKHIGLYPGPAAIEHFIEELKELTTSKGAIQFPLDRDLPLQLIEGIVAWCMTNVEKNEQRKDIESL